MIGLDSSVLVRYLTQDDPVQSPKANTVVERRMNSENPGFISVVALVETVWVLNRRYGFSDLEIASIVERMLEAKTFVFEQEEHVFFAVAALEAGGGFADALIGSLGLQAGCSHTLTFDRSASRLPGFALLS
jgi:predicted nucleic-acid-binding protein